jgi:hypothetical protein
MVAVGWRLNLDAVLLADVAFILSIDVRRAMRTELSTVLCELVSEHVANSRSIGTLRAAIAVLDAADVSEGR